MELKLIKTRKAYQAALEELDRLIALDPKPNSPEADRIELIAVLMTHYDDERLKNRKVEVTPIEMIQFMMEQNGLTNKDLVPIIGSRSRVSEVLSGKRELSKKMILALHEGLGIPIECLFSVSNHVRPTALKAAKGGRKTTLRSPSTHIS